VFIRVLATLVVGGASFVLSNAAGQSVASTISVSVVVGGVVLVVQYLAAFERKLHDLGDEQRRNLATVNAATKLYERLEASSIEVADLERVIESLTTIRNLGHDMVSSLALAELERFDQLRAGQATFEGEDWVLLLALTRMAQGEIVGSTLVDDDLWLSELGERYAKLQWEAVQRGASVRRLFVVEDASRQSNESFKKLVEEQRRQQIDVRTIVFGDLSSAQQNAYDDFVVFDERVYYLVQPTAQMGPGRPGAVKKTQLNFEPAAVAQAMRYFDELWNLADEVP
jgi:hypothetical protein